MLQPDRRRDRFALRLGRRYSNLVADLIQFQNPNVVANRVDSFSLDGDKPVAERKTGLFGLPASRPDGIIGVEHQGVLNERADEGRVEPLQSQNQHQS